VEARRDIGEWSDEQFEIVLARVLRAGVLLAAAIVAFGGILFLAAHGREQPAYHVFRGEPSSLRSVRRVSADAVRLDGRALIQFGLLVLMATPIARVVFSVLGFLKQRDWLYVGMTLVVLALLTYSLLGG
jgi:uncharacterized membrane protein